MDHITASVSFERMLEGSGTRLHNRQRRTRANLIQYYDALDEDR